MAMFGQGPMSMVPWTGPEKNEIEKGAAVAMAEIRTSVNTSGRKLTLYQEEFRDTNRKCDETVVREKRYATYRCRMGLDQEHISDEQTDMAHVCHAEIVSKRSKQRYIRLLYQYIRQCNHYHHLQLLQIKQLQKYQYVHQKSREILADDLSGNSTDPKKSNASQPVKACPSSLSDSERNEDGFGQLNGRTYEQASTYGTHRGVGNCNMKRRQRKAVHYSLKETGLLGKFLQIALVYRRGRDIQKELDIMTKEATSLVADVLDNPQNQLIKNELYVLM